MSLTRTFFDIKLTFILLALRALGFTFTVCYDRKGKNESFRLRYEIYAEEGYIDPEAYPDRILYDRFDEHAIHVMARRRGQGIATGRIIQHSTVGFPVEKLFNVRVSEEREELGEISRLGITRGFRARSGAYARIVMLGLAARMYKESRKAGIRYWLAWMPEKLARSFRPFGAEFEKLREYTPTRENKEARRFAEGYFKKHVIRPYQADITLVPERGMSLSTLLRRRKKPAPVSSGFHSWRERQ